MMKGPSKINSYSIILKLFEARVGLARAIYSDAEVYLLDDPLAAVDSKVSKNFFKISKKNQTKTFILIPLTPISLLPHIALHNL